MNKKRRVREKTRDRCKGGSAFRESARPKRVRVAIATNQSMTETNGRIALDLANDRDDPVTPARDLHGPSKIISQADHFREARDAPRFPGDAKATYIGVNRHEAAVLDTTDEPFVRLAPSRLSCQRRERVDDPCRRLRRRNFAILRPKPGRPLGLAPWPERRIERRGIRPRGQRRV